MEIVVLLLRALVKEAAGANSKLKRVLNVQGGHSSYMSTDSAISEDNFKKDPAYPGLHCKSTGSSKKHPPYGDDDDNKGPPGAFT